ncbi:MAG: ATP synthase F1 subunit delta [Nitrospirae bacterium]|nr:ATP synthase F1 subunit delta [Nitrospirota bacterium]
MKVNYKIAKRYAKALFDKEELSNVEKVLDEITALKSLMDNDAGIYSIFVNPMFSFEDKQKTINIISGKAGFSGLTESFVLYIVEEGFIHGLGGIIDILTELTFEARKKARVTVMSPEMLSESVEECLSRSLEARLGKKVEIMVKIDPSIIGGLVVQVGGVIIDTSITGQLRQLKEELIKR